MFPTRGHFCGGENVKIITSDTACGVALVCSKLRKRSKSRGVPEWGHFCGRENVKAITSDTACGVAPVCSKLRKRGKSRGVPE